MRFVPSTIRHLDTGSVQDIFLPEPIKAGWHEDELSDVAEVVVGDSTVVMPTHLIRHVIEFGLTERERERRTQLGHDCLVFALACESGDSQTDVGFGPNSNRAVHIADFNINVTPEHGYMTEPNLEAGQIAFTADALPNFKAEDANMHFMVRAGTDSQGTLYLSKFGPRGPIAAHRLDASLGFYPAKTLGHASGLSVVHLPSGI
jgi:hypothetical protein